MSSSVSSALLLFSQMSYPLFSSSSLDPTPSVRYWKHFLVSSRFSAPQNSLMFISAAPLARFERSIFPPQSVLFVERPFVVFSPIYDSFRFPNTFESSNCFSAFRLSCSSSTTAAVRRELSVFLISYIYIYYIV